MSVERAAKIIARKNTAPQRPPIVICVKTFGSEMNRRDGPDPASTPNAEHAGKMMNPERSAIVVSRHMILTDSPPSVRFLSKYEPKMAIAPIPSESVKNACPMAAKTDSEKPYSWTRLPKSGLM